MISKPLRRRTLLRGMGGIGIALPFLEAMLPARASAATPPKRLVIVFSPNGTNNRAEFEPQGVGADFTLGIETAAFLPLKRDLLFISGVNDNTAMAHAAGDLHAIGMSTLLTAATPIRDDTADQAVKGFFASWGGGISIDQRIAAEIGGATKFPSIELGVQSIRGIGPHPFSRMSYKDKMQPVPAEDDPRAAFRRLFSDLVPPNGNGGMAVVDLAREQRRSVLDFVQDDYTRLQPKLSARDRQKLDVHFTALREVEVRLGKPVGAACKRPDDPSPMLADSDDPDAFPLVGKLQMDLLALALACDLTRVASLQFSWARSTKAFPWIGVKDAHHEMTHMAPTPKLSKINTWYAEQVAYLVTKMKSIDEVGGTLLDNAVVWWCSDVALGAGHKFDTMRTFLFGGCGGYFKTGQHIKLATSQPHNKLLVTLMHAMGVNANSFGDAKSGQGPLPGFA